MERFKKRGSFANGIGGAHRETPVIASFAHGRVG